MVRARMSFRFALAALFLPIGCGQPQQHTPVENEFNAWADHVERESANGQAPADFEEPANVMDRATPVNRQ